MEAKKRNIKELFENDVRYFIPTFQRPYVWTQDKQWTPLWDDVRNLAEEYAHRLSATNGDHTTVKSPISPHFMGAIVLQQVSTRTAEIERRDVIDGQQRMLTLQLLINAAHEVLQENGYEEEAKHLKGLVLNDEAYNEGDNLLKLWPTAVDRNPFRVAIAKYLDSADHSESPIVKAHDYFATQIRDWFGKSAPENHGTFADALQNVLMCLLIVVVIDLEIGDDAYVIFETMNARGTPLGAADLIKNLLLQISSTKGPKPDDLARVYWALFEDAWWREEINQGRITRPRVDAFLNYWLIAQSHDEVPALKVYPIFRDHLNKTLADQENAKSLEDVVKDIHSSGRTYRKLEEAKNVTGAEQTFLYRWQLLEAGVLTPVLLKLFSADARTLPLEKRLRALGALESFLIRRSICRLTTKDYNRLFLELLGPLTSNLSNADDIIIDYLANQTAESREWPTDQKLSQAILDLPLYRLLTRARMRMVLEALEERMRTPKAEEPVVYRGSLTIEHIMPQDWKTNWPLKNKLVSDDYLRKTEQRDQMIHTMGNLTLVSKRLNPALSNGPWKKKRDALRAHSTLFLNKRLLDQWGSSQFGETQIRERGMELAQLAIEVWPRPEKL